MFFFLYGESDVSNVESTRNVLIYDTTTKASHPTQEGDKFHFPTVLLVVSFPANIALRSLHLCLPRRSLNPVIETDEFISLVY